MTVLYLFKLQNTDSLIILNIYFNVNLLNSRSFSQSKSEYLNNLS